MEPTIKEMKGALIKADEAFEEDFDGFIVDGQGRGDGVRGTLCLNMNDVFFWGCADYEEVPDDLVAEVYNAWKADPMNGVVRWVSRRRGTKPQKPWLDRYGDFDLTDSRVG